MYTAVLLGLSLIGQAEEGPPPPALASHLGMELDDLDFEIRRLHTEARAARSRLVTTRRARQRGVASPAELERASAEARALDAREAEAIALRALKGYERDVLAGKGEADEERALALVLALLKAQEAVAQVEFDSQAYRLEQEEALLTRGAASRPERDAAQLDYESARLGLALNRARQAQLAYEHAARPGPQAADPAEVRRLKAGYLQARVKCFEIGVGIAKARLDLARERQRLGHLSQDELDDYRRAFEEASEALTAERKRLEDPAARPANPPSGAGAG